jgi:hypothetical protein
MPTGWRPSDVKVKYPIQIIEDVYHFDRYITPASPALKGYAVFQLLTTTFLMLFMFFNYSSIGFEGLLLFGAFVFVGIYGYTTLMDRTGYAVWIEVFRGIAGIALIYITGDWFGVDTYFNFGSLLVACYFLITIIAGVYFTYLEKDAVNTGVTI